jgi:hypothetical protein
MFLLFGILIHLVLMPTKLEHIQKKSTALCFNHVFLQVHYSYTYAFRVLKIAHLMQEEVFPWCSAPYSSLPRLQILFLPFVNCWPSSSCSVYRDSSTFNICSSSKYRPTAGCASVANVICQDTNKYGTKMASLHHIL